MKSDFHLSSLLSSLLSSTPQKKKSNFLWRLNYSIWCAPGGYITRIDSMCKTEKLSDRSMNFWRGIGGNKFYDLYLRVDR